MCICFSSEKIKCSSQLGHFSVCLSGQKKFHYKPLQRVKPEVLHELLKDYPDQDEAQYVIQGFTHSF